MATITKRVSNSGIVSFQAAIRRQGMKTVFATFARKTDAQTWAYKTETEMHKGLYLEAEEQSPHTVAEAIDRYIAEELPKKPRTYDLQKQQLSWWKLKLGSRTLSTITGSVVNDFKYQLTREKKNHKGTALSASTINHYLSSLSSVFNAAKRRWSWVTKNPIHEIEREKEPRGRQRFLSVQERERLLEVCKKSSCSFLYLIVVLALSTGMRKAEILNLRWSAADLITGSILLLDTKNKQPRRVAIRGHALELMKAHSKIRRLDTDLVFAGELSGENNRPFDIRRAWKGAIKKAGIENFVFHDLRHCCASYLAMGGASPIEIAEVLGHKTLQMVKRYAHLAESHTANVVERMNLQIFGGA